MKTNIDKFRDELLDLMEKYGVEMDNYTDYGEDSSSDVYYFTDGKDYLYLTSLT